MSVCRTLEGQLGATQSDLESASSELAKTGNSLQHALRSNQDLVSYKLRTQATLASLKQETEVLRSSSKTVARTPSNLSLHCNICMPPMCI